MLPLHSLSNFSTRYGAPDSLRSDALYFSYIGPVYSRPAIASTSIISTCPDSRSRSFTSAISRVRSSSERGRRQRSGKSSCPVDVLKPLRSG